MDSMLNMYALVELRSFGSSKFGFMLPIFSKQGSNKSFVQDLDVQGVIRRFYPIDADRFSRVDWFPPSIEVTDGELGVLAFVADDGSGFVGNIADISEYVTSIDIVSPFVKLEAASISDNEPILEEALEECRAIFEDSPQSQRWSAREKDAFGRAKGRLLAVSSKKRRNNDELILQFKALEADFGHEKWVQIWLNLWQQNFQRDRLIGLASYAVDIGAGLGADAAQIFLNILGQKPTRDNVERAMRLYSQLREIGGQVPDLFQRLWSAYWIRDDLLNSSVHLLMSQHGLAGSQRRAWIKLWSLLFNRGYRRDVMRDLAGEHLYEQRAHSTSSMEILVHPFSYDTDEFRPFYPLTTQWLATHVRSSVLWAELFLAVEKMGLNADLQEIGHRWLWQHGGNTKVWVRVWEAFKQYLRPDEHREMALQWLGRARWDMRVWPRLFAALASEPSERDTVVLFELGQRWLNSYYGGYEGRIAVERSLKYLSAMLHKE